MQRISLKLMKISKGGEVAQWVKHLLGKHEDFRSPVPTLKSEAQHLSTVEGETGQWVGLAGSQCSKRLSSRLTDSVSNPKMETHADLWPSYLPI